MLATGASSSINSPSNSSQPALIDVSGLMLKVNNVRYIILSHACPAALCGTDKQCCSSEMLHWDQYRTQRKIKDVTGSIMKLYQPIEMPFEEFCINEPPVVEMEGLKFKSNSLAVRPEPESTFVPNFCPEMQHWDDFREDKGISLVKNGESMATLFKPFSGRKLLYWDRKDKFIRYIAMSVAISHFNEDHHFYCSEMEHYDDYNNMKQISSESSMKKTFGIHS
ncbi:unnamed protein product [Phytomonas sp. Hart1]|nr:unnamed protein product [Phytomonas sp. Hart1]|eukprot:CCW71134.1 unnamed protein product [Phytomonas sp. isolate Hart1]